MLIINFDLAHARCCREEGICFSYLEEDSIDPPRRPEDFIEFYEVEHPEEDRCLPQLDEMDVSKKLIEGNYRLQIGDLLAISLYNYEEEEMDSIRLIRVDPSGNITYHHVGNIYALGRTIDEIHKEIQDIIVQSYPRVLTAITAVELQGSQYTILGEVKQPGTRPLEGKMTLLDVLARAGGFPLRAFRLHVIDFADLDKAFVSRNNDFVPVDFNRLVREGDFSQNILIKPNDYIYIPSVTTHDIYVLGDVVRPFIHSYLHHATLLEVITWARGVTRRASSRVLVIRGSLACPTVFSIDVNLIFKGCQPDFLLKPGDIVYVPPERFISLKDWVRAGIRAFVGALAIQAGNALFLNMTPDAIGTTFNPIVNPSNNVPGPFVAPASLP